MGTALDKAAQSRNFKGFSAKTSTKRPLTANDVSKAVAVT